jgi:hypothetical protein
VLQDRRARDLAFDHFRDRNERSFFSVKTMRT